MADPIVAETTLFLSAHNTGLVEKREWGSGRRPNFYKGDTEASLCSRIHGSFNNL
jgi:hypothetical protein